jgi:hypothetical protein
VVLQGKCGKTVEEHLSHLAPCHLANIDPSIDVTLQRPDADLACEVCGHQDDEADMLLCDHCGAGWHAFCLVPALVAIPEGHWVCPRCDAAGVTVEQVQEHVQEQRQHVPGPGPQEVDTGTAARRWQAAQLKRAALAEALHGRLVERRIRDQRSRRTQTRRGRLVFKGADYAPHFFAVEYADGGQEAMSLPVAQRWLLPASASMGQVEAARVVLQPDALPASWDLADAEQLRRALQLLMPGDWQQRVVTKLARQLALSYADAAVGAALPCVATTAEEVQWLLSRVNLIECQSVVEPFNGTGAIAAALKGAGCSTVLTNDLCDLRAADMHVDALQPAFLNHAGQRLGCPVDAVVSSPWFTVLDIALPLLVAAARTVVCLHVPGHYVSSGVMPRYAYLQELQRQGRLVVLFGVPRAAMGWRCAWLVVFRNAAVKRALLRPGWKEQPGLVLQ